jgi:hypothetical protein
MPLPLLSSKGRHIAIWKYKIPLLILLAILSGLMFFFMGKMAPAVVFLSYGIILLESRLPLRRLIHGFPGASLLVTLVRAAFFFLPLPFLGLPVLHPLSWGVLAGIACGALLQTWRLSDLQLGLSSEFIAMLPPLSKEQRLNALLAPVLAAIAQEYFYRGAMLSVFAGYIGIGSIILAATCFTLEHLTHFNSSEVFDGYDILMQMLLGLGLGTVFYLSSSLVGCILGHTVYNGVSVFQALRRRSK